MTRFLILLALLGAVVVGILRFSGAGGEGDLDPATAATLRSLHHDGVALIERHDFVAAEEVLLQLVERIPDSFVPRFNLAVAQLNQAEKGVGRALETLVIADALSPDHPKVQYARGVIHEYIGNTAEALASFERAVELAPADADVNYKYAIAIYNSGNPAAAELALPYFEMTVQLDETHLGAWNNLRGIYFSQGREQDGSDAVDRIRALQTSGEGVALTSKYTEQGGLARSIRDWLPPIPSDPDALPWSFAPATALSPSGVGLEDAPAALVDPDLDCRPQLWVAGEDGGIWELSGADPVRHDPPAPLRAATTFAVGDLDEDGIVELVTAANGEVRVHALAGSPVPELAEVQVLPIPEMGEIAELRLVDLDMEGDLDLVIVPRDGAPRISLNEGRTLRAPGDPALPLELGAGVELISVRSVDDDVDADLVLREGVSARMQLVRNDPQWDFTANPADWADPATLEGVGPTRIEDLDGDAIDDLLHVDVAGALQLAAGDGRRFAAHRPCSAFPEDAVPAPRSIERMAVADLDLDGDLDLVLTGRDEASVGGVWLLRNSGRGSFVGASRLPGEGYGLVVGDVDGDLDPDLVLLTNAGPQLIRNTSDPAGAGHHALRTYFGGARDGDDRRTNLLGYGVRIEVRAGSLRVGRHFEGALGHRAQGVAPLVVGLGARDAIDWTYLVWPDGVSQAELDLEVDGCGRLEEVQRKASSCPVLFTWDGGEYRFITDFMGGGGLGFWIGPGEYAFPEPTEVVRIPPDALVPVGGELRLSVMEPMQESCSIDRLALVAVDHPEGTEVYPFEYFPVGAAPPSGAPLLVEEARRRFPSALEDQQGALDPGLLAAVDRRYASSRRLDPDLCGYAEAQRWVVTFADTGAEAPATHLFLDGWVEYPYSRLNFAAWQRPEGSTDPLRHRRLEAPSFWWDRGDDDWQLIGRELGYPAGMPKTMVLDVTEAIAAGATRFRIETNLEIYWDRVFLAPAEELPAERAVPLPLTRAIHRFGGYPREYSDDGALPLTYHYDERQPTLGYQPMGGMFTRYGEVGELLGAVDDRFVVMGGGDELILTWEAGAAPAEGTRRTWLLDTHGYCKDRDPLTATPSSVEPLPFGSMTSYPPAPTDVEPDREEYRRVWNTRRDGAELPSWPRLIDRP